jgi:hypothetical protein
VLCGVSLDQGLVKLARAVADSRLGLTCARTPMRQGGR